MKEDKPKRRIVVMLVILLFLAVVSYVVLAFLFACLDIAFQFDKFNLAVLMNSATDSITLIVWGAVVIGFGIFLLMNSQLRIGRRITKINDGEESKWLTMQAMKKTKNMTVTKLSKLSEVADGIPIYAKQNGKDITVVLAKPIHALVVGTTGSGKSSGFLIPSIEIITRTKTKPCIVVTDPKGELLTKHGASLESRGYTVSVIDLKDIFTSVRWNPFNGILQKIEKYKQLGNEEVCKIRNKYYVQDIEFLRQADGEAYIRTERQGLMSDIQQDVTDIINTICVTQSAKEPSWEEGAKDLAKAITLAFVEDIVSGIMLPEQLCLYNIYQNFALYATADPYELRGYFECREKLSITRSLSKTVLISQDKTLTSYLSTLVQQWSWMADVGIASLTSGCDVDLYNFDEKPNALFLKIPDEREVRYKVVTLLITQMYKDLVAKANDNKRYGAMTEEQLKRNTYLLMDEFANMPKFDKIDKIITVGRSRGIYSVPIVQDFAQLDEKYGKQMSTTMKNNCNIKIYIGTNDKNTSEEFASLCGKCKARVTSVSENKEASVSVSSGEKPLIYASELRKLNDPPHKMGNALVLGFGKDPLMSVYTPEFKARDIYKLKDYEFQKPAPREFVPDNIYYDIGEQSKYLQFASSSIEQAGQVQEEEYEEDEYNIIDVEAEERNARIQQAEKNLELFEKIIDDKINDLYIERSVKDKLLRSDVVEKIHILEEERAIAEENKEKALAWDIIMLMVSLENTYFKLLAEAQGERAEEEDLW